MTDLERILSLWRELEATGADFVLATVIAVEGPSYRKPGALMLLTADGRRAGAISGGCLEAQVASRAWWLTSTGPIIKQYSTAEDDGDRPYGSGCGGVVSLLLERRASAAPFLAGLQRAFDLRLPFAVATLLDGPQLGLRAFAGSEPPSQNTVDYELQALAEQSFSSCKSIQADIALHGVRYKAWAEYRSSRPSLRIFGAGDDAKPLLRMAKELGWFVSLTDGRSHLATRERFPGADEVWTLAIHELPAVASGESLPSFSRFQREDAAIVMTHSFEQDAKILACLLQLETPPGYIGVLGPQRRTRELLAEAARLLKIPETAILERADRWLALLHAPTGLDLGAESPETIALSIVAEIQKVRSAATALPLSQVRSAAVTATR